MSDINAPLDESKRSILGLIVGDVVDSIVNNDQQAMPFNAGLVILFNLSIGLLTAVWIGMLVMLAGRDEQFHIWLLLLITAALFVSFNWFIVSFKEGFEKHQKTMQAEEATEEVLKKEE